MSPLNDPAVIAEVLAVHETYEAALVANDVAVLDQMFWHSADAVRFGVVESLYGYEEIAAFRKARPAIDLARTISRRTVVSFGVDTAITTIEFDRISAGVVRHGRQTQVWRKLDEGWRIVSAHISFALQNANYIDAASALVGLSIPSQYRAGVELNVSRSRAIAQPLLEFDLPDSIEMATVFEP